MQPGDEIVLETPKGQKTLVVSAVKNVETEHATISAGIAFSDDDSCPVCGGNEPKQESTTGSKTYLGGPQYAAGYEAIFGKKKEVH